MGADLDKVGLVHLGVVVVLTVADVFGQASEHLFRLVGRAEAEG